MCNQSVYVDLTINRELLSTVSINLCIMQDCILLARTTVDDSQRCAEIN